MTVPLVVLAVFSIIAGYVSWPHAWGGAERFDKYLDPVFGRSTAFLTAETMRSTEHGLSHAALMGISIAAATAGILLALWLYLRASDVPALLVQRFSGLHLLLARKYYVDEFYDWLVVNPLRRVSEAFFWRTTDEKVIDGIMVNGSAKSAIETGGLFRLIQSGNLRSYATWVMAGAAMWLSYILWK